MLFDTSKQIYSRDEIEEIYRGIITKANDIIKAGVAPYHLSQKDFDALVKEHGTDAEADIVLCDVVAPEGELVADELRRALAIEGWSEFVSGDELRRRTHEIIEKIIEDAGLPYGVRIDAPFFTTFHFSIYTEGDDGGFIGHDYYIILDGGKDD